MADGNIQAARVKLKYAVDRLLEPRPAVYHDTTVFQPSLFTCLVSELGGGQGEDRSPGKSQPPVWIDAMQLVVEIEHTAHKWCPKPGSTTQRLQTLCWQSWRPQDTDRVRDMARSVDHWCESILSLLEPEARKFIDAPCPSCSKSKVWKKDGGGDVVQQPALKWTPAVGFECQSCKAHWSPEQTLFFSRLLGFELPEGVLE